MAAFERLRQRIRHDRVAAADVRDRRAWLQQSQTAGVDDARRAGRPRKSENKMVRFRKIRVHLFRIETTIAFSEPNRPFRVAVTADAENPHSKRLQHLADPAADMPEAQHHGGAAT